MIEGINYPWATHDGRSNYGCDFGRNKWGVPGKSWLPGRDHLED